VLVQARDFAMSIVETVRQPLLVLDTQLRIRVATRPSAGRFKCRHRKPRASWCIRSHAAVGTSQLRIRSTVCYRAHLVRLRSRAGFSNCGAQDTGVRRLPHPSSQHDPAGGGRHYREQAGPEALRRSEEHLRQSQNGGRGRLAGGIAHDLIPAHGIIGYSDLLQDTLADNPPRHPQVLEIQTAGERAVHYPTVARPSAGGRCCNPRCWT